MAAIRVRRPGRAVGLLLVLAGCLTSLAHAQLDDRWVNAPAGSTRFVAIDVIVDSRGQPLAAYQLTLAAPASDVRIVGIEGGTPEVFRDPPYYDPKAIQRERVVLAAFSTAAAERLPKGMVRVATVHLQVRKAGMPRFDVKLQTAAGPDGRPIPAQARVEERTGK